VSRVAFLGLGAMGRPMARRVLDAGHDLRVWNRTPGRGDALVVAGAVRAASPADAARDAEVVITMLADPAALDAVLFGGDGAAGAIGPDATVVDMSTVGPTAIREAAVRLAPVALLDAPVLGSVPHAEAGTLVILVGGDPVALARCEPVLSTMGSVQHVGASGTGALAKVANNAAGMSALIGLGEVLSLTDRLGLDAGSVLDAIGRGPLASFVERWRDKLTGASDAVDFRLVLARKDLALALQEAAAAGVDLTLPAAAVERCDQAIADGRGDRDNTAVVAYLRSASPEPR
jgi:3-hydroxyisobutyrate dehydrogenase-like beta-hydroxyacid dehydrogenase